MHTALLLASTLLALLGGALALGALRHLRGWGRRRHLQLAVLCAPALALGVGLGGIAHFSGRACFLGAPRWDQALAVALPLGMGALALGGLGLGLVRLALLSRVVARGSRPAGPELAAGVGRLATGLGVAPPRVLLCAYDRPLALACGLRRPAVLLSTWMVEHLDRRELEAVLAHELAHVARRDYLAVWLATTLRDAFCYLPTSWAVYRQVQREKELACDDLAAGTTGRPLALASALAKTWQGARGGPRFDGAPSLASADEPIEGRIARLLAAPRPALAAEGPQGGAVARSGTAGLLGLLLFEAANLALVLATMGCGPVAALGGLR